MNGRRAALVGGALGTVLVVAALGAIGLGGRDSGNAGTPPRADGAVRVTRTTLVDATTIDGQLGHGPQTPVRTLATGTVTWLPTVGTVVNRGEPLLRIDDRAAVLLYGSIPVYRRLAEPSAPPPAAGEGAGRTSSPTSGSTSSASPGPPLTGNDVRQFETNLKALGYSGFTVDATFTAQTAAAVKRWQKDLGLPQTGAVEAGDVVYAAGPLRVARTVAAVGAPVSGVVLEASGNDRMVTVRAPASGASWAVAGTAVEVVLPGGHSVAGTVESVGTDAEPAAGADASGGGGGDPGSGSGSGGSGGDAGTATVPVTVSIADQQALGTLQTSPVTVRYVVQRHENVLAVPVPALLALAEGGYGLEVADDRPGHFVEVQVGLFADGMVEVSGPGVVEGLSVRIPK